MYVPATLTQPAGALAPIVISASTTPPLQAPAHTSLRDIRSDLNVLEGHATSVTGKLTAAPISTTRRQQHHCPRPASDRRTSGGTGEADGDATGARQPWLEDAGTYANQRERSLPPALYATREQERAGQAALRGRHGGPRRAPKAGPVGCLSPGRGVVVRRRRRAGVRRRADEQHVGCRQQDAAVWHAR